MNDFILSCLERLKEKNIPNADIDLRVLLNYSKYSKNEIILRNKVAELYRKELSEIDEIEYQYIPKNYQSVYAQFSITFKNELKKLWFDAHVHGENSQKMLFDLVGKERLVYGTNLGGWDTPKELESFAPSLTENAIKLLRL